jgi:UDP:flavonoid glycosyltransferase YjiC (YdhE family)
MSIICVANAMYLSGTSRAMEIYRALEALSVPVRMASHGGEFEHLLDREGIPWDRIDPPPTPESIARFKHAMYKPSTPGITEEDLERDVIGEMTYFRARGAKVVHSEGAFTTTLSARALKIPLTGPLSIPPILADRNRLVMRECVENGFTRLLPRTWPDRLANRLLPRVKWGTRVFNRVARRLKIEPVLGTYDLLLADVTLVPTVPEILGISEEELAAWRPRKGQRVRPTARYRYIGAYYAKLAGEVPADVHEFLQTDKPRIYVAMTSTRMDLLAKVVETLSGMDVVAVVVAVSDVRGIQGGRNLLVTDLLPAHRVMPLCQLAIIHGGEGSVQTAIASGTPVIGFPIQPEQNFNLRLLEQHGAGRCLSFWSLKAGRLRAAIEEVLGDGRYRREMLRLQGLQARLDGPTEAAKVLKEVWASAPAAPAVLARPA